MRRQICPSPYKFSNLHNSSKIFPKFLLFSTIKERFSAFHKIFSQFFPQNFLDSSPGTIRRQTLRHTHNNGGQFGRIFGICPRFGICSGHNHPMTMSPQAVQDSSDHTDHPSTQAGNGKFWKNGKKNIFYVIKIPLS